MMSVEPASDRKPFWAKCTGCQHCWPAAYLPMEIFAAAKLMKAARCPMCGKGPKGIAIAKQKDGVLTEPAASTQGAGA